jgi:hypothetical protein
MSRKKIEIDKASLIAIINSTQAGTLTELCETSAKLYNKTHQPGISASIVRLRIGEWKIPLEFEKQARGEHLKNMTTIRVSDEDPVDAHVFMPLTDWEEEKIERGRFQGQSVFKRMVLGVEPMNWSYWCQTKSGSCQDPKYFGRFRIMLPHMKDYQTIGASYLAYPPAFYKLNIVEVAQRIADELAVRTNKPKIVLSGDLSQMGEQIDVHFKVDLARDNKLPF